MTYAALAHTALALYELARPSYLGGGLRRLPYWSYWSYCTYLTYWAHPLYYPTPILAITTIPRGLIH